jgi:Tol biopolymer transport system component
VRRITRGDDSDPTWSPDGRRIAFIRDGKGIYVVDASGSGPARVLKDPVPGQAKPMRGLNSPTWSPDGTQLAFQYKDGLGVVNLTGAGARTLLANEKRRGFSGPAWSPDGKTLAFADFLSDAIYAMDMSTGQQRRVTGACNAAPDWAPDSRRIACWNLFKGNAVHVVDVATAAAQRLTKRAKFTKASGDPSWSPDGLRILFTKLRGRTIETLSADVYVMTSDGTGKRRLIRNALDIDWGRQP